MTTQTDLDPWPWLESVTLPTLSERFTSQEIQPLDDNEIFRVSLANVDIRVSLWTTRAMQRLFELTGEEAYFVLALGLPLENEQNYVSPSSSLAALTKEIASGLGATYGWIEPDFLGISDEYKIWHPNLSLPTSLPPWHLPSRTRFIDQQLGRELNQRIRLSRFKDELHIETLLGERFWITPDRGQASFPISEEKKARVAETALQNALKAIPASILES